MTIQPYSEWEKQRMKPIEYRRMVFSPVIDVMYNKGLNIAYFKQARFRRTRLCVSPDLVMEAKSLVNAYILGSIPIESIDEWARLHIGEKDGN